MAKAAYDVESIAGRAQEDVILLEIQERIAAINALIARLPPQFRSGPVAAPGDMPFATAQALLKLRGEVAVLRERLDRLAEDASGDTA